MPYKIIGGFTVYHLILEFAFSTLGAFTQTQAEALHLNWIFYLFPPMYILLSGPISMLLMVIILILLIRSLVKCSRKQAICCAAAFLLHAQYLIFYFRFLAIQ